LQMQHTTIESSQSFCYPIPGDYYHDGQPASD
jgi:hypothetical protein